MTIKFWTIAFLLYTTTGQAQSSADTTQKKHYQAKAPITHPFGAEAFKSSKGTTIHISLQKIRCTKKLCMKRWIL